MRTEDLIDQLAREARPTRPLAASLATAATPALLASAALLLGGWGLRTDLMAAWTTPGPVLKAVLPALGAAAALAGALRLARPDGEVGPARPILAMLGLAALALMALALLRTPPADWGAALRGETLLACLLSIPALAVLPTAALLLALRRGASPDPLRSGALAGLAGGGLAAALYALHCPEDHPLFFVTWYGTGVLVATAAGAAVGRRLLRW